MIWNTIESHFSIIGVIISLIGIIVAILIAIWQKTKQQKIQNKCRLKKTHRHSHDILLEKTFFVNGADYKSFNFELSITDELEWLIKEKNKKSFHFLILTEKEFNKYLEKKEYLAIYKKNNIFIDSNNIIIPESNEYHFIFDTNHKQKKRSISFILKKTNTNTYNKIKYTKIQLQQSKTNIRIQDNMNLKKSSSKLIRKKKPKRLDYLIKKTSLYSYLEIFILLGSVLGLIFSGVSFLKNAISQPTIEYIVLDSQPHHIGDVNNSNLFPEAPNHEGNFYVKQFNLSHKREEMYLIMKTRDIDPNIEEGPASVYINNQFAFYLNSYVHTERRIDDKGNLISNFASLEIPINTGFFQIGENNIIILVGETDEEILVLYENELYQLTYINTDDIEFWDLQIKLIGNREQ
ncbi:MAG: hypothetical protein PHS34_08660 [Candidatus Omnitrophica bacterium]|nr:hypothetical protein [Candidatus Nanoarchaeia archaeon]MDD5551317.1 hypothetical protein [Candidatus Omnitrophota bacterium]